MTDPVIAPSKTVWGLDVQTYCLIMHLSHLLHGLLPGLGIVIPVVMWTVNKDEDAFIDANGRVILNWIISSTLYAVISFILVFVVIGVPLLMLLGLLIVIFAIVGGLKAFKGQVWKYPLSIPFFKVRNVPLDVTPAT